MQYIAPGHIVAAKHITKAAEQKIKNKTGMTVTLVLCPGYNPARSPEQLLSIVAGALRMDVSCYK